MEIEEIIAARKKRAFKKFRKMVSEGKIVGNIDKYVDELSKHIEFGIGERMAKITIMEMDDDYSYNSEIWGNNIDKDNFGLININPRCLRDGGFYVCRHNNSSLGVVLIPSNIVNAYWGFTFNDDMWFIRR